MPFVVGFVSGAVGVLGRAVEEVSGFMGMEVVVVWGAVAWGDWKAELGTAYDWACCARWGGGSCVVEVLGWNCGIGVRAGSWVPFIVAIDADDIFCDGECC